MIGQIGDIFARSCEELTASVTKIASYACTIGITLHILIHCNSMEIGFTKIILFQNEFQNWQINLYTYLSSRSSRNGLFSPSTQFPFSSFTQFVIAVHSISSGRSHNLRSRNCNTLYMYFPHSFDRYKFSRLFTTFNLTNTTEEFRT